MFKQLKELGHDSLIYGLGSTISQFVGLFLVPFYTKALAPSDYGILAIIGLFTQFLGPVSSFGLDNALFRYFSLSQSQKEEKSYLSTAAVIKLLVATFFITLTYFSHPFLDKYLFEGRLSARIWLIVLATIFFSSIGSLSEVVIRIQRKPRVFVFVQLVVLAVTLVLSVYWVLILEWGVYGALLASMVGVMISAITLSIYIRNFISYRSYSFAKAKTLLGYALPYVPHGLQIQTIQLFSLFIVNQHMGIAIAGIYSVVSKFVKPIWLIVGSVQKAWVPYKFQLHKQPGDSKPIFRSISGNYWFILVLIWCISCLLVPSIFRLIINERYYSGLKYFPFLAFIPLVQAFYFTATTGIELGKSQKILPIATFFGMLTVVSISLLTVKIIPPYGPMIAQSLAFFVVTMISFKYARKLIKIDYPFVIVFLYSSISIIIVFLNYRYENLGLTIISLLAALGIFLGVIFKFNGLDTNLRKRLIK